MTTSFAQFTIRELDLLNDADLQTYYQIEKAHAQTYGTTEGVGSLDECTDRMRHRSDCDIHAWAAFRDGHAVVAAWAYLPTTEEEAQAWITSANVPTEGDVEVLEALIRHAEEHLPDSRTDLVWQLRHPLPEDGTDDPLRAAVGRGFELASSETTYIRALPVAETELKAIDDSLPPALRDGTYRVETYIGGVPAPYRAGLCALMALVEREEFGEDAEPLEMTPEDYADEVAEERAMDWQRVETVALTSDNVVVGATRIDASLEGSTPPMEINYTYVQEPHRGHRLGLAMNSASLRMAQQLWPHQERLVAQVNTECSHLQSLYRHLGYRPVSVESTLRKHR